MTTTTRYPWGDGPAPALDCERCGNQIAEEATHWVLRDHTPPQVWCYHCFPWGDLIREPKHAKCYPDCPHPDWHEDGPHWIIPCSRGAAFFFANGIEMHEKPLTLPSIHRGPWPLGPDAPDAPDEDNIIDIETWLQERERGDEE